MRLKVLQDAEVVVSTLISAGGDLLSLCAGQRGFDAVIIDEVIISPHSLIRHDIRHLLRSHKTCRRAAMIVGDILCLLREPGLTPKNTNPSVDKGLAHYLMSTVNFDTACC